jgi:hypothetical protein
MVLRNLVRIAIAGAEAVGKAFARAVQEEIKSKLKRVSAFASFIKFILAAKHAAAREAPSTSSSSTSSRQEHLREAERLNGQLGISLQVYLHFCRNPFTNGTKN